MADSLPKYLRLTYFSLIYFRKQAKDPALN